MTYRIRCEKCVFSETFMDIEADSINYAMEIAESKTDDAEFKDYDQSYDYHIVYMKKGSK